MIKLKNVSKYYTSNASFGIGVKNISTEFKAGEFVAITGESGSGKSTLLNVISGLDSYEEGEIYIAGEETSHYTQDDWENYRNKYISFIFQNYNIIESFTVYQNVILALELRNYPKDKMRSHALDIIKRVGLEHRAHHKASKLSGGEKQRTVIARALVADTPILVADEPTGNLDSQTGAEILLLLSEISKEKLVILVTHEFNEVSNYATRKVRIKDGEIVEDQQLKPFTEVKSTAHEIKKPPTSQVIRWSLRGLLATPKRTMLLVTLQIIVMSVFILVYAFMLSSKDIVLGDTITNETSNHQIYVERRDGQSIDPQSLSHLTDTRAIYHYESSFSAYRSYSATVNENIGVYSASKVTMESVDVLNQGDFLSGGYPLNVNQVVINQLTATRYNLIVGSSITLLATPHQNSRAFGDVYEISGITTTGNYQSIFFHTSLFSDVEMALQGFMNLRSIQLEYVYLENNYELKSTVPYSQIIFSEDAPIDSITYGDSLQQYTPIRFTFKLGPIYGDTYEEPVDLANLSVVDTITHSRITVSIRYKERLLSYFFDDYKATRVVIGVANLSSGLKVINQLDSTTYRVFYDGKIPTSNSELSDIEYSIISYILILFVGMLLYSIYGVVIKHINTARKKELTIFRSLGTTKKNLAYQLTFEQLTITFVAFIASLLIVLLLGQSIYFVRRALVFVFYYHFIILFIILLLLSYQVTQRFNRKMFSKSVMYSLSNVEDLS